MLPKNRRPTHPGEILRYEYLEKLNMTQQKLTDAVGITRVKNKSSFPYVKIQRKSKSPHVQIALVTGFSIIILACVSKRFLSKPIGYLSLAIPPFIATIHSVVMNKHKDSKTCKTWYWIVAILVATGFVILFHEV